MIRKALFALVLAALVPSPVLKSAQEILAQVQSTRYSHRMKVDREAGIYELDCSHFVGLVLQQAAPEALKEIPKEPGFRYPRAFAFCDFFRSLGLDDPRWEAVAKLEDAQPGDVLAWRMAELQPGKDTGHVAILAETPQRQSDGTFLASVIDASEVRHFDDSRHEGVTGIGTGKLLFRVNDQGAPTEVKFHVKAQWHAHLFGIGRVRPQFPSPF